MTNNKQPGGPPPIVVADEPLAMPLIQQHLPAGFRLSHASTLEAAKALVKAETPLVLCGCHFDDGRMYDLLRWMRASPPLKHVPFLAVRMLEGQLDDAIYESVKIAVDAVGGDGFIDLYRWQLRYGDQSAGQRLAQRVDALLRGEDPRDSV